MALAHSAGPAEHGPTIRLSARPRTVWIRRELPARTGERAWVIEVELELPAIDPERLLAECEQFLVDGRDGATIGVVERVETSGGAGTASALIISAGALGRRRLRIDAQAVEALLPADRRLIVDESRLAPVGGDRS